MTTIAKHNYPIANFNFPLREKCHPGFFSSYKNFFRGSSWELFATPFGYGPRHEELIAKIAEKILPIPAVYEFAVSKSIGGKRYKTYLGQTVNMKQRHGQYVGYVKTGDHVGHMMKYALEHGLFLYRRIRYIIPNPNLTEITRKKADLMGLMWETRLLAQINYAWNTENNGKSHDKINHTRNVKVSPFLCFFSKVKFEFVDPRSRAFYKI